MGIPGNPRRLVAEVAFRLRIIAVTAHLGDLAVIDEDLDAAIDVADVAGGLLPFWARHRMVLPVGCSRLHDGHHRNNAFPDGTRLVPALSARSAIPFDMEA